MVRNYNFTLLWPHWPLAEVWVPHVTELFTLTSNFESGTQSNSQRKIVFEVHFMKLLKILH